MFFRTLSLTSLACTFAAPAFAEVTPPEAEAAEQSIVVTGQRGEYGAEETRSATRTDKKVKDVPQSMSVVSESQIEDQDLRSIAEVLNYVPGATPGTGEGNRDQITLRGNNTTADFFVNGVRDDVQYFRDLYNAERIEILRGPNAMIFGRGGGGGVVNRVTKRPSLSSYGEVALQGDAEGGYRLTGDLDRPLSAAAGVRLNGVYENGESFRREVGLERYAVNPTAAILPGPETRLDLSYEYFHDRRTADRGVPAFGNRPLEGARRTFFGDPELSVSRADVHLGSVAIEHELGSGLSLRNRTLYGDYDKFYQNVFPSDLIEATGEVRLSAYNQHTRRKNLFSQSDLVWETDLGGAEQTLLVGFEAGRQESVGLRGNGFFQPSNGASILVPGNAPTVEADVIFRPATHTRSKASILALYAQDQLRLSRAVEIVAGLRLDRFRIAATDLVNGRDFSRTDTLVSPRLGLILKPTEMLSFYASYSRSYLPSAGDQFASLDLISEALEPERFDNVELGAKWEPIRGLLATAAVYRLDRTNTRAVDPLTANIVLTGAQRSRGIELGLERNISNRWQVSAGYALQEAEIRRDTAAAPAGRKVPLVPRHQFSVWNRYDFGPKLGLGLGVLAASKSYASISNAVTLPAYARVDAALFYELLDGIEAQVNVENLFGARYFATAHNDNNIAPGAPRGARATIRFRF